MATNSWPCPDHPKSRPTVGKGRCSQCIREYNREYKDRKIAANDQAWYEYRRRTINNYTARLRQNAMDAVGPPRCTCCGIDRVVFLVIDHINNDGNVHRSQHANSQSLYRSIIADPDARSKYQILCHNCNAAKHIEPNHTCP
jgi:hypothetical protein